MQKAKEIQRLISMKMSDRAIARALKINRRTVQKYKESLGANDTTGARPVPAQDCWYDQVDWQVIGSEIRKGVPVLVVCVARHLKVRKLAL
jgi:hypothetical protein